MIKRLDRLPSVARLAIARLAVARLAAAAVLIALAGAACGTALSDSAPAGATTEPVASAATVETVVDARVRPTATAMVDESVSTETLVPDVTAPDADTLTSEAETSDAAIGDVVISDGPDPTDETADTGSNGLSLDVIESDGGADGSLLVAERPVLATVDVVKLLKPSVVHIATEFLDSGFMDQPEPGSGVGTGIILDMDGHVLTNNHVVAGAQSIVVTLNTGESREAVIIGTDPVTDLAVIKIDLGGLFPARLGVSADLQVGEDVIAIGHALGLAGGPTVSKGVVSALGRSISTDAQNTIVDLIQTDASINPGNSGGPLVNDRGEVIGINTAIIQEGRGIGFAINIDDAKVVAAQLIAVGFVERGFLGVTPFNLTSALANQFGIPVDEGVIIQRAVPGSGADLAGLRQGDVIVSLADVRIRNTGELSRFLIDHYAGETIALVYYRGARRIETTVTLTARPE